jgi:hypothetical protein
MVVTSKTIEIDFGQKQVVDQMYSDRSHPIPRVEKWDQMIFTMVNRILEFL